MPQSLCSRVGCAAVVSTPRALKSPPLRRLSHGEQDRFFSTVPGPRLHPQAEYSHRSHWALVELRALASAPTNGIGDKL